MAAVRVLIVFVRCPNKFNLIVRRQERRIVQTQLQKTALFSTLHEILFTVLAFLFFSATGGVRNTKLGHVFAEPLVWILGVDDVFD